MKSLLLICLTVMLSTAFALESDFPSANPQLTPGALCTKPDAYRYPEKIAYCNRDVTFETKDLLIKQYDEQLGYKIESLQRGDFKIDHFIPLCAGGGNEMTNLWPQHKSVYEITDPIEPLVCKKMSLGKLKQADAIRLIVRAKMNLSQANDVIRILNSL